MPRPARCCLRATGKTDQGWHRLGRPMGRLFFERKIDAQQTTPVARAGSGCEAVSTKRASSGWLGDGCGLKRLVLPLRPGDVVSDDGHDRYSGHTDKQLREQ